MSRRYGGLGAGVPSDSEFDTERVGENVAFWLALLRREDVDIRYEV